MKRAEGQPRPGSQWPGVGVEVWIFKNGHVLVGRRVSSHGTGSWCPPGGKLDFGESWEACAKRETLEEAGLQIDNVRFVGATNDIFEADQLHFITISVRADWVSGQPVVKEPDKTVDWQWRRLDDLPQPLFLSPTNLLKSEFRSRLN